MPVRLRNRKRKRADSEVSMSEPELKSDRPADPPLVTMEMPDRTGPTLMKVSHYYAPFVTDYIIGYNKLLIIPPVMYIPFLNVLGVGPHMSGDDLRPPPLKGVSLYDILKGSTYTALLYAKSRLVLYYTAVQNANAWPEKLYPPQATSNVPWFTRLDAVEARVLIENGLDWCLKREVPAADVTLLQHAVGLWRILETALQTAALLQCLTNHVSHQNRFFRGLRQIRYASQLTNYHILPDDSREVTASTGVGANPTNPPVIVVSNPAEAATGWPLSIITTGNLRDTILPGHPGISNRTIRIVRPVLPAYDKTRISFVQIPHNIVAPTSSPDPLN